MPKRNLIARVLEGLPASSDSVASPDHPLLLRGPDILASVNDRLTAYFVLDQPVRRLPARFLSTVLLCRLALPRETSFILVLGEETLIRPSGVEIFEEVIQESAARLPGIPIGRMSESRNYEYIEPLGVHITSGFPEPGRRQLDGGRYITRYSSGRHRLAACRPNDPVVVTWIFPTES